MKVMHLGPGFDFSGVTAGMMCLARHGFYDRFSDIRIVGTSKGHHDIFESFDAVLPGRVDYLARDPTVSSVTRFGENLQLLRHKIALFKPDALILSTSPAVILGRLAARRFPNLKTVVFEHHTLSHLPERRKRALRETSPVTHLVFGDTPATLDVTSRTLYHPHLPTLPSYIVPLTLPVFGKPRIKQEIQNFEILSLGRLDTEKNYGELIHAAAQIIREGYHFNLTIAGEGKLHRELEALVESYNLAGHIKLPGYVADPGSLRAKAHLYIQPSRTEGLCLGFIEAAAAGMAILGTNVGGMRDLGIHGYNMIKIQGFDRKAIAQALRLTLDNYSTVIPSISKNAIVMARQHFSESVVKNEWACASDALHELCSRPVVIESRVLGKFRRGLTHQCMHLAG